MIAIVDYGMGNLRSVQKACENVGLKACITAERNVIEYCDKIILPGVGAFKDAMQVLTDTGLAKVLTEQTNSGKYLLGICLGHQLLFESSFENGEYKGLGLIKGKIIKFKSLKDKIPHIGWNNLELKNDSIWNNIDNGEFVYFDHSYYADCDKENIIAYTHYCGHNFAAGVRKDNIIGMQFHPEKSGKAGLTMLKNFGEYR